MQEPRQHMSAAPVVIIRSSAPQPIRERAIELSNGGRARQSPRPAFIAAPCGAVRRSSTARRRRVSFRPAVPNSRAILRQNCSSEVMRAILFDPQSVYETLLSIDEEKSRARGGVRFQPDCPQSSAPPSSRDPPSAALSCSGRRAFAQNGVIRSETGFAAG
jgi:hypothetical protein